jgi:hypothetical protein
MLRYEKLKRNQRSFIALTGLTPEEFKMWLPAFSAACQQLYPADNTLPGKRRQRQSGGGRKGMLQSPEQQLLFVLVYQKAYPLQELLGAVFEISQPRVNYRVHRLLPALNLALEKLGVMPERDPRQFARHERRQAEPLALIIDGTERRRQRPKSPEKQALHYSGKKKAHSDKNLVIVPAQTKRVGDLSRTYVGKTHDKKMADAEQIVYPRQARLYKDTGFQGYEPRVRETRQPKKSRARAS